MMDDQSGNEKGKGASGNILLVDDDKFLVVMYSMKFTGAGFNVQACLSVADALRFLRDGFAAEAIVFDIVMPEHDGFSFLQTLDAEHLAPSAVKIALTNQGNDAEKAKAEGLGVDRYVVKASMIPSEVVEVVKEEVEKHGKKK